MRRSLPIRTNPSSSPQVCVVETPMMVDCSWKLDADRTRHGCFLARQAGFVKSQGPVAQIAFW